MKSAKSTRKTIKISALLSIYLNLHCLSCVLKFKCKCLNLLLYFVSMSFIIINFTLYLGWFLYYITLKEAEKSSIIFKIIKLLEFFLLILFFLKRRKMMLLNRCIEKIHSSVAQQTRKKFRNSLIVILVINDIYIIILFLVCTLRIDPPRLFSYLGGDFIFFNVKAPASTPLFYFSNFMVFWGKITAFIPVYFSCLCFALKQTINGFKRRLDVEHKVDFNSLEKFCTDILIIISHINDVLHDMLLLSFIILLGSVFVFVYKILIGKISSEYDLAYYLLNAIICFVRYSAICMFASAASKAGVELKDSIYNCDVSSNDRWKYLRLYIKVNERFVQFRLLDSLVLDKNLILASMGSLVTYGVIIATFNINSKS